MAIIQISKIQVRSGNLVDLPQLDDAEFGWASDQKKLYIGKTTPNENIEILTSYSDIYFSQMNGSYGNLNITTPVTGQLLTFNKASNTWVNTGGNALDPGNSTYYSNTPTHLGDVSDVFIGGGAIGYVLETDGTGNLSWTPKGTISANITGATQTNPVVITTSSNNFFTDGMRVTITNVGGMTQLNGNSYYANVLTANTFSLYSDSGLSTPVNGTAYGAYTSGGRAIASVSGSSGGSGAGGATYSVQYNSGGISTGDANFQWNYTSQLLSVIGTANITQNVNITGNVTASRLISNVAVGTAPLTVTSTTRVANLNVAYANVSDFTAITTATTGVSYLVTASAVTGNVAEYANANLTFDAASGTLTSTKLSATGNANVGNLGTTGVFATTLSASGNANVGNLGTGGLITATGNVTAGNLVTGGAISATGNANVGNIGAATAVLTTGNIGTINSGLLQNGNSSVTIAANGNITITAAGGTPELVITGTGANVTGTLSVSGNANIGNIGTAGLITATGNVTANGLISSNGISATGNANVGNLGTGGLITASGNITGGNIITAGIVSATGNLVGGNLVLSNAAIITVGANTNVGTITGNWTLSAGSRLQATYADLAEYYEADIHYEPGTVLEFGGEKEVTLAQDGTTRVAGVVSADPAYVMNTKCPGIATAIALQGRVPVKVRGKVSKGDMMVSGGNGFARPTNSPQIGTIIGKALENFDGVEGVIEIAVGRL